MLEKMEKNDIIPRYEIMDSDTFRFAQSLHESELVKGVLNL